MDDMEYLGDENLMNCPFCKKLLSKELEHIERTCPYCHKDVYDEIHANFKKFIDFGGKFVRINHENKSFPFVKVYFPEKQTDFFSEKGAAIAVGDTIDLNNIRYRVVKVAPFFNSKFYFAEIINTEIIRQEASMRDI